MLYHGLFLGTWLKFFQCSHLTQLPELAAGSEVIPTTMVLQPNVAFPDIEEFGIFNFRTTATTYYLLNSPPIYNYQFREFQYLTKLTS
jgi:hypothetical protein